MFAGLKKEPAIEAVVAPVEPTVTLTEAQFNVLLSMVPDVPATRTALSERAATKAEVAALISSIEQFGLQRGLLAFANYNGALTAAIPAMPALESLEADLSTEASVAVLEALKAIDFDAAPAQEELRGFIQWFVTITFTLGCIIPGIIAYAAFSVWNDYRDEVGSRRKKAAGKNDSDEKIASVVPYATIVSYLHELIEVPVLLKNAAAIPLPKTEEDYGKFLEQLEHRLARLSLLGVRISKTDHIVVYELASPILDDIRKLGYAEDSLKNIADLAKHDEVIKTELHALHETLKALNADGDKISQNAIRLLEDIVHTALIRMTKILQLVKHTCQSIEHFYKKA